METGTRSKGRKSNTKQQSLSERMELFRKRRDSTGVDWTDVNPRTLRCAIAACLSTDVAVMFAPAAGGQGVLVKVYEAGVSHPEFVLTASDLETLLDGMIDAFQGTSEDLRVVHGLTSLQSQAAD